MVNEKIGVDKKNIVTFTIEKQKQNLKKSKIDDRFYYERA